MNIENKSNSIEVTTNNIQSDKKEKDIMTPEEEQEMFTKYVETKDKDIRNQLIIRNLPLAKMLASNYASIYKINLRIIQSYAYEGLCNAVDKFNPSLGNRFSTFANQIIIGMIKNGVIEEEKNRTTEVNPVLFSIVKPYIKRIEEMYEISLFEAPNLANEIIDLMLKENAINKNQIELVKKYLLRTITMSLEGENIDIPHDGGLNNILSYDLKEQILMSLNILNPKEKEIIILRYGLFGELPKTCEDIGKMYGITKGGVSYIEQKALKKIRRSSHFKKLAPYYNEEPFYVDYGHTIEKEEYDEEKDKSI